MSEQDRSSLDQIGKNQADNASTTERFDAFVRTMPSLLEELKSSPAVTGADLGIVPARGIYVFYEGGDPFYVGRSRRMRSRLREHCQPNGDHYSATLAFRLAKQQASAAGIDCKSAKNAELVQDERFQQFFAAAKSRLAAMTIRFIEVEDPAHQTVFEVYAALALGTQEHNDFETH